MTMTIRNVSVDSTAGDNLKEAMRRQFGGVSVITTGAGARRTGLTATSAISLSLQPPTMLVCVNRNASAWPVILSERHFCVNILGAAHRDVANRFAGRRGVKGAERYEGDRWRQFVTGAWGLEGALAVIDCSVEEIIERHSHGIVVGAVRWVHVEGKGDALIYGDGAYHALSLASEQQDAAQ